MFPDIPSGAMYNAAMYRSIPVVRATREVNIVVINKDLTAASSTPLVLAILAEGDSYGYAILQRVRELSGGRMEWTDGMLYPVLHRLERLGHVEARWEVSDGPPPSQVLPAHVPGSRSARRGAQAMASRGRDAAGHLAAARSGRPPGVRDAHASGRLTMTEHGAAVSLEEQIDQWRSYLRRRQAIHSVDVAELEDHLREQVAVLTEAGLATDEAFLVAVKRMGALDALSREFAREHSDRLWKQLVVSPSDNGAPHAVRRGRTPSSPSLSRWRRPSPSRCRRCSASIWTRTPSSTPATSASSSCRC